MVNAIYGNLSLFHKSPIIYEISIKYVWDGISKFRLNRIAKVPKHIMETIGQFARQMGLRLALCN